MGSRKLIIEVVVFVDKMRDSCDYEDRKTAAVETLAHRAMGWLEADGIYVQSVSTLEDHTAGRIAALMSGAEWDSDTTSAISEILKNDGYEILESDEMEGQENA